MLVLLFDLKKGVFASSLREWFLAESVSALSICAFEAGLRTVRKLGRAHPRRAKGVEPCQWR